MILDCFRVVTPIMMQMGKYDMKQNSDLLFDFDPNEPHIPLGPPVIDSEVNFEGKLVSTPDAISINVPPHAVAENNTISIQTQCFAPMSSNSVSLPEGMKLLSPIYRISAAHKEERSREIKFLEDVELTLDHYARLQSNEDCVSFKLCFVRSKNKKPFKKMLGGLFETQSQKGTIFLRSFCEVGIAGSESKFSA